MYTFDSHSRRTTVIFSGIGAAIFMVVSSKILQTFGANRRSSLFVAAQWLAIDIQMVIGGKRMEMSPEDYVLGALVSCTDEISLLMILSL